MPFRAQLVPGEAMEEAEGHQEAVAVTGSQSILAMQKGRLRAGGHTEDVHQSNRQRVSCGEDGTFGTLALTVSISSPEAGSSHLCGPGSLKRQ